MVELVRIGNMEELSELGKEIDGEAQQSCSLLEGGEGHQRGGYHLPPSKDDGPYGLHGLAVIVVFDQQWTWRVRRGTCWPRLERSRRCRKC